MSLKSHPIVSCLFLNAVLLIVLLSFPGVSSAANTPVADTKHFKSFVRSTRWCRQQVDLLITTDSDTNFRNKKELEKLVALSLRKLAPQCKLMKAFRLTGFVNNKGLMRGSASSYENWAVSTYGLRGSTWAVKAKPKRQPQKVAPTKPVQTCDTKDFNCAVLTSCQAFITSESMDEEKKARLNQCVNQSTQYLAKQRQQTYAAEFFVDDQQVRLFLGKHVGVDNNYGDWCGETLWGKLQYPMYYNVLPSVAKTIIEIINSSLSKQCPEAKRVSIAFYKYSPKMGIRQTYYKGEFLQAYKENNHWYANLHPAYVQSLQAKANMSALWSMISTSNHHIGYAMGMARYNKASNRSLLSRYARYAKEGKVCELATGIRHCYVHTTWTPGYGGSLGKTVIVNHTPQNWSSCPTPCDKFDGYCNMETGAKYKSVESAERANCRAATKDEIKMARDRVQIDNSVKSYPYKLLYLPYDRLPENYR